MESLVPLFLLPFLAEVGFQLRRADDIATKRYGADF
jgi:hypothetical protein